MICRAYRAFFTNALGFCPCQLDLNNSVGFSDLDFAFPSWLNIQFWVSRLQIKDSIFSDRIPLCGFPGIYRMKVKA